MQEVWLKTRSVDARYNRGVGGMLTLIVLNPANFGGAISETLILMTPFDLFLCKLSIDLNALSHIFFKN